MGTQSNTSDLLSHRTYKHCQMQCVLRRWNVYAIGRNATERSAFLPARWQRLNPSPRYMSCTNTRLQENVDVLDEILSPPPPSSKSSKSAPRRRDRDTRRSRSPSSSALSDDDAGTEHEREQWQIQKAALKEKFGDEAWNPQKRLSPDTLEGIRTMHNSDPYRFTTPVLAEHFKVSPEAIRRILKSKWQPSAEIQEKRRERWERRGERVWSSLAEVGVKPPKPWRVRGVGKAETGEMPVWKGKGGGRRSSAPAIPRATDGTTIRKGLVAERAASAPAVTTSATSSNGISGRML